MLRLQMRTMKADSGCLAAPGEQKRPRTAAASLMQDATAQANEKMSSPRPLLPRVQVTVTAVWPAVS